jgi:hypothetical protein
MFKKPKKVRGVRGGPVEVMDMEEEDEEEVVEIQTNINKIKKEKKKKKDKDKDKEKKEEKKTSSLLSFDEEAGEEGLESNQGRRSGSEPEFLNF